MRQHTVQAQAMDWYLLEQSQESQLRSIPHNSTYTWTNSLRRCLGYKLKENNTCKPIALGKNADLWNFIHKPDDHAY